MYGYGGSGVGFELSADRTAELRRLLAVMDPHMVTDITLHIRGQGKKRLAGTVRSLSARMFGIGE